MNNENLHKRVLLAMSGGVDSAAAAILLARDGYEVTGVTFLFVGTDEDAWDFLSYADGSASAKAKEVCDRLSIGHIALDKRGEFRTCVTEPFVDAYASGGTPNPCVECNRRVKIRCLYELACELGCDFIATGHYATPVTLENGRTTLRKAADTKKDQTYMLYRLPQELLSRLLLPLGAYTKPEIRALVSGMSLSSGDDRDSQDICFIPDGDYAAYMEKCGFTHTDGDFIDENGNKIGRHRGFARYTCGQRKGLGVAFGHPVYVIDKSAAANTVTLGEESALFGCEVTVGDACFSAVEGVSAPTRVTAKLRYTPREGAATLFPLGDGTYRLVFDEPQRAATRGQHAVFYVGDVLFGGGVII